MPLATDEAEALQGTIERYLRRADREGDVERMAQRIALAHGRGSRVVGFRRDGRELFVHEVADEAGPSTLAIVGVDRDGRLDRTATVWRDRDLRRWLEENHHYLEWIAPGWR
ncbi:hypothetical protein [Halovivax limisalsi]|uniref:hypothetical protein n=1 Tax=Halovivax limisalsi TaxID=1453760 RepID=UPI001FFD7CB3|nr:hypothetical protein [Halovivax limisalsi]